MRPRAGVTNSGEGALSYRTRCSHLFCDGCARAYFARGAVICPVCDGDVGGEAGILRLSHAHGLEQLAAAFAFAASFPEDALAVAAEGIRFRVEQTALAGTREIYVRAKQAEAAEAGAAESASLRVQLEEVRRELAGAQEKLRGTHAQLAEARRMYSEQQQRVHGSGAGGIDSSSTGTRTGAPTTPQQGGSRGGSNSGFTSHDIPVSAFAATSSAQGYPRAALLASPFAPANARPVSAGTAAPWQRPAPSPTIHGVLHALERAPPRTVATPMVLPAGTVMQTAAGSLRITQAPLLPPARR